MPCLLFVVCLIPLTHILRQSNTGYHFSSNGEKINHLLFMDDLKLYARTKNDLESLVKIVRKFSSDIGVAFGIDKCAVLTLKKGKTMQSDGITMPNRDVMKELEKKDSYKYIGILQVIEIKYKEMNGNVRKEYIRRVKKVLG